MSNVGVRAALAAAASTVDGVAGFPQQPDTITEGAAWPMWRGAAVADGVPVLTQTWSVVFAVGADLLAVDEWVDAHLDEIWDALQPIMHIDDIAPTMINTGIAGLTVTGTRE